MSAYSLLFSLALFNLPSQIMGIITWPVLLFVGLKNKENKFFKLDKYTFWIWFLFILYLFLSVEKVKLVRNSPWMFLFCFQFLFKQHSLK